MRLTLFFVFIFFSGQYLLAQNKEVKGKVVDQHGEPLIGVNIQIKGTSKGTQTDPGGQFTLPVSSTSDSVELVLSHIGFIKLTKTIRAESEQIVITMEPNTEVLDAVNILGERQRDEVSVIKLKPKSIEALPSPFGDFNAVLSTLPGVVSNNELSSAYSVRGGSFDENLVYVNDIPIYRPFLISNGQQEGLSFINTQLVSSISFSAGGWQPKLGDKLSSVLSVNYKRPKSMHGSGEISLLGASAHIEGLTKNKRVTYVAGVRHKSSQYLLNTLETQGQYLPKFTDLQSYVDIALGPKDDPRKTTLGVLASYARNRYLIEPENRETEFGTFTQSLRLFVAFDGREILEYDTYQGGINLSHAISDSWRSNLIVSLVNAHEREFTDIEGGYRLCDVDKNPGSASFNDCVTTRGVGTEYQYGRNTLQADIVNVENRNKIDLDTKNRLEFGYGYSMQVIDDELNEFSFIDSAGFVLEDKIETAQTNNKLTTNRYTVYVQNTTEFNSRFTASYGVRLNYLDLNDQLLVSPRAQLSFKPNWVRDIVFRGAVGLYQQQPFYREFRDFEGNLNKDLKAQKSIHLIGGLDYNFRWWGRPFKFLGEVYYKKIYDVVPYDIDNVKVRYYANNNAEAFATGIDMRVSGEFIAGTESWFSLGILNVREDVAGDGRGYIRRPTDQRVNVGVFFQDHLPNNPSFRVNLSLLFGSGLPFGPPQNFKERNTFNGDSYRRVDVGFSKIFKINNNENQTVIVSAEILNLLGTSNPISYTWINDVTNTQIAVPNSLSARFLNIKLGLKI